MIKRKWDFKYVFSDKNLDKMRTTFVICSFYNLESFIYDISQIYKFRKDILLNVIFIYLV